MVNPLCLQRSTVILKKYLHDRVEKLSYSHVNFCHVWLWHPSSSLFWSGYNMCCLIANVLTTLTQSNPDNQKYDHRAQASSPQFFGTKTCQQSSENIIHKFYYINYKRLIASLFKWSVIIKTEEIMHLPRCEVVLNRFPPADPSSLLSDHGQQESVHVAPQS